jgi:hypothetical protein
MARIVDDPNGQGVQRVLCDAPKCVTARRQRGEVNGRFIFYYEWRNSTELVLTLNCPECGQIHTLTLMTPGAPQPQIAS